MTIVTEGSGGQQQRTTLEWALKYHSMGISVIPLNPRQKTPAVPELKVYFTRRTTEEEIREWFANGDYNIGVITGEISRLFVLDVDGEEAKKKMEEKVLLLPEGLQRDIGNTMRTRTGKGGHLWFRYRPGEFSGGLHHKKLWVGKDSHSEMMIKAEGGYVVAPPSIHPDTGSAYEVLNDAEPILLVKREVDSLEHILTESEQNAVGNRTRKKHNVRAANPLTAEKSSKLLKVLEPLYQEGVRQETAMCLSGYTRKQSVSIENSEQFMTMLANKTGDNELPLRLEAVRASYQKEDLAEVNGISGLAEIFTRKFGKEVAAEAIFKIKEIIEPFQGGAQPTPGDMLYELAILEIDEKFLDQSSKTPYCVTHLEDSNPVVFQMEGEPFRFWLSRLYKNHIVATMNNEQSKLIGDYDLNKVIRLIIAEITEERVLHLRCFFEDGKIYYDFQNKKYQYAVITPEGYKIKDDSYHYFKRFHEEKVQVLPEKGSTNGGELLDAAIKSFNILDEEGSDDKNLLFKVNLISKFLGRDFMLSLPIDTVNGPPGSSKSSLLGYLLLIVDPVDMCNVNRIKQMVTKWGRPEDSQNRGLAVAKNHYVIFDNIGHKLSPEEQDELSMFSTGGMVDKRKLYHDMETIRYSTKGFVGYTSVTDVVTQADTINRQLKFDLDLRLDSEAERKFWAQRIAERPAILEYIFGVLSRAIPNYQKIIDSPDQHIPHRLGDFLQIGEAITQGMGYPASKFTEIMVALDKEQNDRSLENNPVVAGLLDYIKKLSSDRGKEGKDFEILAKEFFEGFKSFYEFSGGDIKDFQFPRNAISFGAKMKMYRKPLYSRGVDVIKLEHARKGNGYRVRTFEIDKDPNQARLVAVDATAETPQ